MFMGKAKLKAQIKTLRQERLSLKTQVEDLKLSKKITEEDIKHMVRIKEERLKLEFQKKEMNIRAETANEVAAAKSVYQDKLILNVEGQKDDIKEMYGQILERLPDINVKMRGKV